MLLAERRPSPRPRFGEVLPPRAWAQLTALGGAQLFDDRRHLRAWTRRAAWGRAALVSRDLSFHPYGCAWHLDRKAFDADLLRAARRSGVAYAPGVRLQRTLPQPGGSGWIAELEPFGTLTAAFVVDATGRASAFARRQGVARLRLDRMVALVAFVEGRSQAVADLVIESGPGGWWYTAPLPSDRTVVAFLSDADLIPSGQDAQRTFWMHELRGTAHVAPRLRLDASVTVSTTLACTERLATVSGEGWVAVGDSAASFDPLSSLGLAHAIETGRLASLAVDAALAGESRLLAAYVRLVQRRADDYDVLRRGFYTMERRWAAEPFWARRIGYPSIPKDAVARA